MAAKTAILAIRIISDATKAAKGLQVAESKTSRYASAATKAGKAAGRTLAVGVGAAAVALAQGAKSAVEDAAAQASLAQTLKKTAGATDAQVASTEDWITKTALAKGVADDELRPALARLSEATHDVGKAQGLMGVAMDVAAARHVSLESVTKALAKAQNGQVAGLSRLGVATKDAHGKTIGMKDAVKQLQGMYGGQAATAAETLEGKQRRLKIAYDETMETLGAKLIPILTTVAEKTAALVTWATQHGTTVAVVAGIVGGFLAIVWAVGAAITVWTTITKVASAVTKVWAGVQWLMNAALAANPVALVVLAIVALVAIIVVAYKKSETFRNIVQGAFRAVQKAASAVFEWVKKNWPLILAILTGPIGLAVLVIVKHWDKIKAGGQAVLEKVKDIAGWIKDHLVAGFGAFKDAGVKAFHAIIDPIKTAIRWVKDLLDKIANIHIPSLGDIGGSIFGGGGIFGFAGTPEPAPSLFGTQGLMGATALSGGGSAGGAFGSRGRAPVQIIVQGALDPDAVARQIEGLLGARARRLGRS